MEVSQYAMSLSLLKGHGTSTCTLAAIIKAQLFDFLSIPLKINDQICNNYSLGKDSIQYREFNTQKLS